MVTVPLVEQKVQGRGLPTGGYSGMSSTPRLNLPEINPSAAAGVGRAQANLAESMTGAAKTLGDIYVEHRRRGDQIALVDFQSKLDRWETENLFDPQKGALAKKGRDAFNTPVTYAQELDKFYTGLDKEAGNDFQREKMKEIYLSRRNTIEKTLMNHERGEMDSYAKSQTSAAIESSMTRATLYYANPDIVNSSIKSAQDVAESYAIMNGMPPEAIANQRAEIASKAHLGVLTRMADASPKQAIDYYTANLSSFGAQELLQAQKLIAPVERKYKATEAAKKALEIAMPVTKPNEMTDFVIDKLEGGDQLVPDGNGIAKYGINSAANPDVDVANLTREQAAEIYKKRYYEPMKIDELPADMRLVAYDAAVNHGVGKAKELVKEANGDVRLLLSLRSKEYERLAKENPEKYGQNLKGWINRLGALEGQVDVMRGAMPTEYEVSSRIDSMTDDVEVAEDAKKIVKTQLKSIEDARKQREAEASDEAWQYVQGGREVPPSVEARMSPKEISEMRKASPDPEVYERVRAAVVSGQDVNLGEYRWRLGGKYDELVKLREKPEDLANARKVDDVIKNSIGMLIGRSTPKGENDYKTIEQFRRAVDLEIQATQRAQGKAVTVEQVEKITDRLRLDVAVKGFNNDVKLFELFGDEQASFPAIPDDREIYANGVKLPPADVMRVISNNLAARRIVISEDTIEREYENLVKSGRFVEKEK